MNRTSMNVVTIPTTTTASSKTHRSHDARLACFGLGQPAMLFVGLMYASLALCGPSIALAQDLSIPEGPSVTNTTEGVRGSTDKKDREPTLSVTAVSIPSSAEGGERVKLLAYAEVASHEFKDFPIRYDFYVNQRLLSSQIRSIELNGPVGVDVTPDVATQPFNYSVVATVLHPNRQFTTVLNGASFASDLVQTLDCTLTLATSTEDAGTLYQVNGTESAQRGNDTIVLSFNALREDEEAEASVTSTITLARAPGTAEDGEINATATANTSVDDTPSSASLTGSVSFESGKISAIALSSADETTILDCSASA